MRERRLPAGRDRRRRRRVPARDPALAAHRRVSAPGGCGRRAAPAPGAVELEGRRAGRGAGHAGGCARGRRQLPGARLAVGRAEPARRSPRSSRRPTPPRFELARSRRPSSSVRATPQNMSNYRQGGRGIAVIAARRLDSYTPGRRDRHELARRVRVGAAPRAAPELEPRRHDAALARRAAGSSPPRTWTRRPRRSRRSST